MPAGPRQRHAVDDGSAVEAEALERAGDIVRYRGAAVRVDDENAGAHGAFPRGGTRPVVSTDQAVMLGAPVGGEVEGARLEEGAVVEVAGGGDDLVIDRAGLRHDLPVRRDDGTAAQHVHALLPAGLGDAHHPGAVLIGAGLHGKVIVEGPPVRRLEGEAVERRRVVADQHQLHALQAEHAGRPRASAGRCRSACRRGRRAPPTPGSRGCPPRNSASPGAGTRARARARRGRAGGPCDTCRRSPPHCRPGWPC